LIEAMKMNFHWGQHSNRQLDRQTDWRFSKWIFTFWSCCFNEFALCQSEFCGNRSGNRQV